VIAQITSQFETLASAVTGAQPATAGTADGTEVPTAAVPVPEELRKTMDDGAPAAAVVPMRSLPDEPVSPPPSAPPGLRPALEDAPGGNAT
jgi:hypothetical protein